MATATALLETPHLVPTRILDQAGARLLLEITLLARLALVRPGTAITTDQAAGVLTAEAIPGAVSETFATINKFQLQFVGLGLRLAPFLGCV